MSKNKRAYKISRSDNIIYINAIKSLAQVKSSSSDCNLKNHNLEHPHAVTTKIIFHGETGMYEVATYFHENVCDSTLAPQTLTKMYIPFIPSASQRMEFNNMHACCSHCVKSKAETFAERNVSNGSLYHTPTSVKPNETHPSPASHKS